MFTTRRSSLYSNVTKKVTQARKGLGTNSVGLATELSLVSKLLQKVIPKKISAFRNALWAVKGSPAEPLFRYDDQAPLFKGPPFLRACEVLLYRDYVSTQTSTPVIVLLSQR